MISDKDEHFGVGINLFMEKYSEQILSILSKFKNNKSFKFTCFAELVGENSFAGRHNPDDELDVVLFDIWIHQKGWIEPKKFIDIFSHLGIPELIYEGTLNMNFISDIKENRFNLKEGVIAKGIQGKEVWMVKIKTNDWLNKVRQKFGEKYLLEELNNDKSLLI